MKKTGALCLAFFIVFQTMICAQYPTEFGANGEYGGMLSLSEKSAASNIFYVDAHPFVLLDTDADGNYFVIADEYYAKGGFAYTSGGDMTNPQKFDINGASAPANRVNAAVYINSEEFYKALPERIYDNIIPYNWVMEQADNFNGYSNYYGATNIISDTYNPAYDITSPYVQQCKIALLSRTELNAYQDLIGYSVSKSSSCLAYASGSSDPTAWLLRTPFYTGGAGSRNDQAEKIMMSNGSRSSTRDMSNALRPVFFLDKDFFKTTVIDSSGIGSAVIEEILGCAENDTGRLLEMGYSIGNLINMGLVAADESIAAENLRLSYSKAAPAYTLAVSYDFAGEEDERGTMFFWYISDDDSTWSSIAGESGRTYTVKNQDAGKYIKGSVRIKTSDGKYGLETDTPSIKIGEPLQGPPNSTVNRLDGHAADTPEDYIIATAGGARLSLLDCRSTEAGYEYFVTTNESSGQSPTQTLIFDPDDAQSVAYALENYMYASNLTDTAWAAWTGNASYTCAAIDNEVKKHILLHEFVTEASPGAGVDNDYLVNTHIALMSYNEFIKYYERFGYYISAGNYWMLRTARPDGKLMVVDNTTSDPTKNGRIATGGIGGAYKIRPVFWLDGDFFTQVRLNVAQTGAQVKNTILRNYTREQLRLCGYTDEELDILGFESASAEALRFDGAFEVQQKISISYTYKNSNANAKQNQIYEWYRADSTDGIFEKIEGAEGAEYSLTEQDMGKYIKAVVIPLTSVMTKGTPSELISSVAVRSAPEYIVTADSISREDGVSVDFTVNKLSEGTGSLILIVSVFDKENAPAAIGVSKMDGITQGKSGCTVSVNCFGAEDVYYVRAIAINNLSGAKPILTKTFR